MWKDWKSCMKNKEKKYFPLFTDLTEKKIVVCGAGEVAGRRVRTLLGFAGEIVVVAPECSEEIRKLSEKKEVIYKQKNYEREDIYDADMVIAATDNEKVNEDIYSACKCLGILVNVASSQQKCDFHFPGIIEYDGVVLGFNGAGKDHKKVRKIREKTERLLKEMDEKV